MVAAAAPEWMSPQRVGVWRERWHGAARCPPTQALSPPPPPRSPHPPIYSIHDAMAGATCGCLGADEDVAAAVERPQ